MASLKWVKICTTITGDWKMGKLLEQPQGKRLLLAWILLLCFAGELNEGGYFIKENQPLIIKDFKNPLKETTNFLNYSFKIFMNLGILGVEENTYYITNWSKYQNEDKLEQIREKDRIRKREAYRKSKEVSAEFSAETPQSLQPQNKNKNENKNNIYNNLFNHTQNFSLNEMVEQDTTNEHTPVYEEPAPIPPGGATTPANISQIITDYCALLPQQDNPTETQTLLLTWLGALQEKNRLPTASSLLLLLEKLPNMVKESRMKFPEYLREVICRGWLNFYPVPAYQQKNNGGKPPRNSSINIDELEAMI